MRLRPGKLVFYLLMIALIWVVVEIAAFAGHAILDGRMFSPSSTREQARTIVARSSAEPQAATDYVAADGRSPDRWVEAVHPYFGVVADPDRHPAGVVSDLGFVAGAPTEMLLRPDPGTRMIGIFGGSFAGGISSHFVKINNARLGDDKTVIANFAKGGYKQPQQLMILAYLLALGAQFDTVINIDGFNEVALPPVENVARGVNPFYPRQWHLKAQGVREPDMVRKVGYLQYLEVERGRWARRLLERGLYRSAVFSLVWRAIDQRIVTRVQVARQKADRAEEVRTSFKLVKRSWRCLTSTGVPVETASLLQPLRGRSFEHREQLHRAAVRRIGVARAVEHRESLERCTAKVSTSYTIFGPKHTASNDEELYRDLAGMWERSSLEMKALCEVYGVRYFHFLQPNQYVAGSKPMTPKEQRIAINKGQHYRRGVIGAYPLLRELGQKLIDRGVAFSDLTMIFEDNSDVLYADDCCHLNRQGYGLVVNKIIETITADGSGRPG